MLSLPKLNLIDPRSCSSPWPNALITGDGSSVPDEHAEPVETAAHGDDALALLQRQPYGVVLLDEHMPGRRGLELCRAIRVADPETPVVMVTKSEDGETLKDAIGAKYKIITGLRTGNDNNLAMERGEIHGWTASWENLNGTRPQWVPEKKVNLLVQFTMKRMPYLKDVPTLPGSLDEALNALEADHDFLLKGDVFSPQLIERWIAYKREKEIQPLRMRPHPFEFGMYFDI